MCLNHPQTIPPPTWSTGNSSVKSVSGTKKVGDRCLRLYVVCSQKFMGPEIQDLLSKTQLPVPKVDICDLCSATGTRPWTQQVLGTGRVRPTSLEL